MTCSEVTRGEMIEKYLLGHLQTADQEAFEQHYLTCVSCFEALEAVRALQTELRRAAPAIRREAARQRVSTRWVWAAAAAAVVLLSAGLGLWLGRGAPSVLRSAKPTSGQPSGAQHAPGPVASLSELAAVQPPPYAPALLRGTQDEAAQRFREAMRHYVNGDYQGAIPGLEAASKLNPRAADASFFLGICFLLTAQTDLAINHLRSTAALGDSPFLEEAHFYLAKAHLRTGELDLAQTELRKTIDLHGELAGEARRLLDQVERFRQAPH